ncbi:MAG: molecular chaperone DnaJ [Parcubacteria group bacterium]|nr:molecular chaperone DnaJ [Parcubacteria group bacterium]
MSDDYYSLLGVEKGASAEEIKKAYRKLAHQHHPDKKGGDEAKFKKINEAYQVLGNQEKRQQYDQFGQMGGDAGGFDFNSFSQGQGAGGFDFGDIDLGDLFRNMGGFGNRQPRQPVNRGKDIRVQLKIDLKDTLKEVEKKINLSKMTICTRCDGKGGEPNTKVKECFSCRGTGWVQQMKRMGPISFSQETKCPECKGQGKIPENPCNVCKGEGRIKTNKEIVVPLPAGVDTGQTLRFQGEGEAGKRGAESGDLYITIVVKDDPIFLRKADDLFTMMPISFSQATLGDEVDVSTLGGKKVTLKVPQGTESGKVVRIGGKGIPHFSGWGTGDLFVEFQVKTPNIKKLNKKQKELLKQLKKEGL